MGTRILAAELGDDAIEILLRSEVLALQHFQNGNILPHIGDRGFFEGHGLMLEVVIAHGAVVGRTTPPDRGFHRTVYGSATPHAAHDDL